MGRLVLSVFMTVDGVMEAPGLEEHRDGRNAWALRRSDAETQRHNLDELAATDAFLFGRRTYQIWAAFWPTAGEADGFGERINALPKYVVSTTLRRADWNNTTVIRGNLAEEIPKLKARYDGDIVVEGSADLLDSLIRLGLIDEYRIQVFPVLLGSGKRLFAEGFDTSHLRLVSSRTFRSGVVLLTYQPEDEVPTSEYVESYAWTEEQVESLHAAQDTDRVLATILFTDIVDSTARAAALGVREWRKLLDRHDEAARAEVARWHGQLIKTTGDGILATFDAPTRALRCAFALRGTMGRSGVEIRAAIHTGEIEMRNDDVGGIGVHIASRALAEASGQAVVVTRTVRDLATGTDLRFTPLGSVGLRGVPGEWQLFEASID
jgi:class 3 adenylate cyclase/dihydrofolate reductase